LVILQKEVILMTKFIAWKRIVKVSAAMDKESLDTIAKVYELVVEAGVYRARQLKLLKRRE